MIREREVAHDLMDMGVVSQSPHSSTRLTRYVCSLYVQT